MTCHRNPKDLAIRAGALLIVLFFLIGSAAGAAAGVDAGGGVPLTTDSDRARALFEEGRSLVEGFRDHEAAPLLRQAIEADPDFALAHLWLGKATRMEAGSRSHLETALALAEQQGEAISEGERLWIRIENAAASGNHDGALELQEQLVAHYARDPRVHTELGSTYLNRRRYADAVEHLQAAVELDPDYTPAYNSLGYAYEGLEDYQRAEQIFRRNAELQPQEPNAHHSLGEFLLHRGRYREGVEVLGRVTELDKQFFRAYIDLASGLVWLGDYEGARRQLDLLYENAPDPALKLDAYISKAVSFVDEGRFDDALAQLDLAFAEAEAQDNAFGMSVNRTIAGRILLHAGRFEDSAASFRRSVAITELSDLPEHMKARAWRDLEYFEGRLELAQGHLEAAAAQAARYRGQVAAAEDRRGLRLAHELKGRVALARGEVSEALEELAEADLLNPRNFLEMGRAHLALDDREAALEMIDKAAHFNRVNSFMYAFIRTEARRLLAELQAGGGAAGPGRSSP